MPSKPVASQPHPILASPTHLWTARAGKVRPMILLWALGIPIPVIIVIFLVRGCMS